ncbi:amino acid ABC transporter substrate-binding protein [Heyndrickxia sporothermodurans]|uniref:Amino acid ABC transporter substrate-binding protein n=2 Tax=Heyndrickxia sporothermodurans TaxID=46224 RepID=A0AB37HAJ2_9BACI|nr:ABC transporter substrate-binding protein [Heyndrickxia sporothermodurans]MBL5772137.1 amino acid ABC transporter substrate-binding protein [Heyndrickxia sporothermodurans]MBL5776058.1 amino acid ABC transporter substrate-binding protein [Heyndrickxia sporothermodurans]MBL5782731.1 amino acid ABC transporter substrate-binding protein [Heyndrickxia sporothermodurans]MBL5797143.1 amino acid ABC transporter substrate-binding protein [Heyndrickxia sporothermodurans]MBL5800535.1 amino acid ABC t
MRKYWLLMLALLVFLGIASGCGSKETGGSSKKGVLDRVEDAKVLKVGFEGTYPPFNFLNDKKEYEGFDVDISNEMAKRLGVKTEFVATKWESLIGGLKSDKFDIIIGQMTVTDERKKSVDFTDPYVVTGSVLVTRKDTDNIKVLNDIKGKDVGVGGGTTFEEVAKSVDGANVKLYKAMNDYVQDLINKRLDVIINDQLLMSYNIKEKNLPIQITSDILNKDEIGMAVKKGNEDFVKKVNQILQEMKEDGKYNEIYKKWFGTEPLVK